MFEKAFPNKKDIKEFKTKYSNGEIDSEVISNLLQPYHQEKFPEISDYCKFWWPEDIKMSKLAGTLQLTISHYGIKALEESFGKYDFSFEGNRKYKNYILKFEDLIIVAPAKREVILPETKGMREKLIQFENVYCQFVLNFIFKHYEQLEDFEKESLAKLKVAGIVDSNNQIDFQYFKSVPTAKLKLT